MNFIQINGKKSFAVQGLLIQSLPPVSKPLMRSQIDEIDGRDGDIITKLGYSAYDRPVKIGLTRYFDIDQVIEYFNSSGEVIFSNEPYKIYNFDILQKIDFERLIRFRQATVQFHCQPFKHSSIEKPKIFEDDEITDGIQIQNEGNIYSKPTLEIFGAGDIDVTLNGTKIFDIELGTDGYIVIDAEQMEAYKGNVLKNRLVTGNYDDFRLKKGLNTLEFDGNVETVVVSRYSRWI